MKSQMLHLQYRWNCKCCQIFDVKKNGMMIWHTGRIQISTYACQLGKFQGKVDIWSHQSATQIACLSCLSIFCILSNSDSSPRPSHTPHESEMASWNVATWLNPKMWSHDQPMGGWRNFLWMARHSWPWQVVDFKPKNMGIALPRFTIIVETHYFQPKKTS